MSGVVFQADDARPRRELGGKGLYFCCGSCAEHFDAHRDAIVAARRLGAP